MERYETAVIENGEIDIDNYDAINEREGAKNEPSEEPTNEPTDGADIEPGNEPDGSDDGSGSSEDGGSDQKPEEVIIKIQRGDEE